MFRFAIATIVSSRYSASRGLLAWIVVKLPSWPVFMACSMSSASSLRTSPTMMRSGRIRRALTTSSRARTAPLPSMFAGRVSSRTTCRCRSFSSAASSIVTTRSFAPMKLDSMFSSVVLPAPVPPDTMRFRRQAIAAVRNSMHRLGPRLAADEILGAEPVGAETANRHRRAVERQRRNDRVDTRAVRQAGVHHRARLVDAPADGADDALDDLHQVPIVLEDDVGFLELAFALDVDLVVAVDQNVRDRRIAQQHLERAEAEQLVEDVGDQRLALEQAQRRRRALALDHADDQAADLRLRVFAPHPRQPIEIEPVQQLLVDAALQILIVRCSAYPRRRQPSVPSKSMTSCPSVP